MESGAQQTVAGTGGGREIGPIPDRMKAYRLMDWQRPPELVDVPVPEPGPGEVLVKVAGAGACHSDLHLMEWPEGTFDWKLPMTLGHENAGWIAAFGESSEAGGSFGAPGAPAVGDAVIVQGPWGCGHCRSCRLSEENYCERQAEIGTYGGGLGLDGGMAEYMVVPSSRFLIPLGNVDPREAAPLSDAALTPYHAIKRSLGRLVPGSTVVVIGIGGLGHMAIELLGSLSPSRIVAVDVDSDKLDLARELGADLAIEPDDEAAGKIRDFTGGLGAELILDMVGSDPTLALSAQIALAKGEITVIGLAGGSLEFAVFGLPYECQVQSTYWGSGIELMEVVALAGDERISAHIERFDLEQVAEAYDRMRRGELRGRAVVCPHG